MRYSTKTYLKINFFFVLLFICSFFISGCFTNRFVLEDEKTTIIGEKIKNIKYSVSHKFTENKNLSIEFNAIEEVILNENIEKYFKKELTAEGRKDRNIALGYTGYWLGISATLALLVSKTSPRVSINLLASNLSALPFWLTALIRSLQTKTDTYDHERIIQRENIKLVANYKFYLSIGTYKKEYVTNNDGIKDINISEFIDEVGIKDVVLLLSSENISEVITLNLK